MKALVLAAIEQLKDQLKASASGKIDSDLQPLVDAVLALPEGGDVEALLAQVAQLQSQKAALEVVVAEKDALLAEKDAKLASVGQLAKSIDAAIEDAPQA